MLDNISEMIFKVIIILRQLVILIFSQNYVKLHWMCFLNVFVNLFILFYPYSSIQSVLCICFYGRLLELEFIQSNIFYFRFFLKFFFLLFIGNFYHLYNLSIYRISMKTLFCGLVATSTLYLASSAVAPPSLQSMLSQRMNDPVFQSLINSKGGTYNWINGADNNIKGMFNQANGDYNSVTGILNQVNGKGNDVKGVKNNAVGNVNKVGGISNNVAGDGSSVNGHLNNIYGNFNGVFGNANTGFGNFNYMRGDFNKYQGNFNTMSGVNNTVVGDGNGVKGVNNNLTGNGNNVTGAGNEVS